MSKRVFLHLEVSPRLNELLEEHLKQAAFKTKSSFIRTAVRDRLKEERNMLESEAKNRD